MADDDQQQQRYWFPYWSSPPAPARAPRPVLRPQLSRRDTRPAPPVTPSPSRRQPQPAHAAATTAAPRTAAAGAGTGPPQPQPTRVSSRTPPPSRGQPLSPVREPNSNAAPPVASATKPPVKPDTPPPQRAAHEAVPKELDIVVPQEKIIREPPSDTTNTQSKSVGKEKEKENDKEKYTEKKDKDGEEEKEKEHKEKGKEKEKEHKEKKDKDKKHKEEHVDESKVVHSGKLHKELKSGVADMVHKLGATVAPSSADHHAPGTGSTVITLAGENKGASMKISHAEHAESNNKDAKTTTTKEPRARNKLVVDDGRRQEARGGSRPGLTTAFVNSNVQVVNNSLVLQSSCSSNDPGVHLKLSSAKSKKKKGDDGEDEEAGGKGGGAAAAKKK